MATTTSFTERIKNNYNSVKGISPYLEKSPFGRMLKRGVGESFGFTYNNKGINQGFLGRKEWYSSVKSAFSQGAVQGAKKQALLKAGGGVLGGALGLGSTAYMAYSGYQEEGIWGAAKGIGTSIAANAIISKIVLPLLKAPLGTIGGMAIAGYGAYQFTQKAREYGQKTRGLEMGGPAITESIYSMGAQTMRQRSLQAIQNTHLNNRQALGNEAYLLSMR